MKSRVWLSLCLIALVGLPLLATAERSPAAEAVTDMGALRRQVTSGEFTADVQPGGFITVRYDDYGWVSWQIAALKYKPPTIPLVLIVGGSAVRECLTEDDELAADIAQRCGTQVKVVTAATMMQRLPSTLAIIDNLPPGSGVVVIGVHHPTFVATQADAEAQLTGTPLLLTSGALREVTVAEFGDAPTVNILSGLQHYVDAYERKRGSAPFTGREFTYLRHRYDSRGALPLTTKQTMAPRFSQGSGAPGGPFDTYLDFNVALLQRCVAVARAKGYEVLLMQDPLDTTAAGATFAPYVARYQPEVQGIARTQKAHYADLNKSAGLVDGDFFDLFHLLGSGRDKWTAKLGESLAEIVHDLPPQTLASQPPRSSSAPDSPAATAHDGGDDKAAAKTGKDKANKQTRTKGATADDGGWPVWLIAMTVATGLVVAGVAFLAVLRRRAVVRRGAGARARARARRRAGTQGDLQGDLTLPRTECGPTPSAPQARAPLPLAESETTLPL